MRPDAKKVIYAAMAANLLIAATKFTAAFFTGSSAMISEGIHSLVDSGDQVLLLYGMKQAALPPSEEFPFGHGKEIYFWSFVVSILIFGLGAGLSTYEGILHLLRPTAMKGVAANYAVLGAAVLFEGISWVISAREFGKGKGEAGFIEGIRRGKDPTLFLVLLEDSAALLGLGVALVGITLAHLTGNPVHDGAASVIIGLILAGTAMILARETKGLLVGESAVPQIRKEIREVVSRGRHVERVNEILTLQMGPAFILVTISADFADSAPAGEIEEAVARMEEEIVGRIPDVQRVYVEPRGRGRTPAIGKKER